jgi:hypothetical protein
MKNEEIEGKNFVDFISDACKSGSTLLSDFLKVRNTPDVLPKTLQNFFVAKGYKGVSTPDCEKLIALPSEIVVGTGQKY